MKKQSAQDLADADARVLRAKMELQAARAAARIQRRMAVIRLRESKRAALQAALLDLQREINLVARRVEEGRRNLQKAGGNVWGLDDLFTSTDASSPNLVAAPDWEL